MALFTPEQYVLAFCVVMCAYGAQMLLIPSKMVSQFFTVPVTPIITFWVRGISVWAFGLSYAVYNLPTDIAVKLAVAITIGTAVMWPFNAKFGYFEKLPVIHPKHHEPEILLSALILPASTPSPVCELLARPVHIYQNPVSDPVHVLGVRLGRRGVGGDVRERSSVLVRACLFKLGGNSTCKRHYQLSFRR